MTASDARQQRYTGVAIALHWVTAALIIYNLRDKGTDANDPEDGFGLVRASNTTPVEKKKATASGPSRSPPVVQWCATSERC